MIIDLVRKPIQVVGLGVVGAGTGLITGALLGGSVILANDTIGFVVSGGKNDQSKPLKADATQVVMLTSMLGSLIVGGVVGATIGAIV
jgi:hypothetical protein